MIRGRDIVCFSTADWDTALPTNKHQIMTRLARANRVLFLETLGTRRVRMASGADWSRVRRRLGRFFAGPRRIPPARWPVGRAPAVEPRESAESADSMRAGIWVLSPAVAPRWENPLIARLNARFLRAQLRRALRALGFRHPIAWIYSPHAIHALAALQPALTLYHMVDDLSAVPGAESGALRRAERDLLRRADLVICTAPHLRQAAAEIHPDPRLMENVADFEHFHRAAPERLSPAGRAALDAIERLPRPRLVFSGHLTPHKVDFPLLAETARRLPEAGLALIGPVWEGARAEPAAAEALRALRSRPHTVFTGRADYNDLPPLLHAADLLLIPYAINQATRNVSPLKFYEYLATGLPIAATPIPSLLPCRDLIPLASTPEEFAAAIERELRDPAARREERLALARRHTWEERIGEISRLIEEFERRAGAEGTEHRSA